MNRPKEFQVGWTAVFCVVSTLLLSASLIECTSNTNVSIVVTTPSDAVNTSSTVLMVCVAHGNPTPSIEWQYGDTSVTNCTSQRHTVYEREIETELNTTFKESILEICSTEPEDSGEYLCTANNGFSSASATNPTNLTVIPETPSVAVVVTTPSDTVNSGSTVLLVCVAYGSPESPSITWLFNGAAVTNSTSCQHTIYERRIQSAQSNFYFTESILEVCDVGVINSGEYLCTASLWEATANATNATMLTVLNEAPPPPANCSSVPVFNEEGTLISINFNWAQVDVSEEVIVGSTSNLNITSYTLSLGGSGTHRVPSQTVCQNSTVGTCSYSYPVGQQSSLPSTNGADYTGQVAAENVAGSGQMCSLQSQQTNSQVSSSFLTLSDSTDANTIMVECSQSGSIGSGRSFKCEFCYNFGRSCQSSLTCMDVIPGSGSATPLPSSLAEGTYCYRATAIVDGIPARMIQDTFSIRSPCSNTEPPNTSGSPGSPGSPSESSASTIFSSIPVTASISAVIALIVGLLIGCLFGGCLVYMCTRRKKLTLANLDNTITRNEGAVDMSTKYLTINSAYGSSKDTTTGQEVADGIGATQAAEAPQYEDMDEIRKAYQDNKNEFELSENNAYSRAEDVTESFYDNDAYMKTE